MIVFKCLLPADALDWKKIIAKEEKDEGSIECTSGVGLVG